jgi:3-oxoacyl-[acyl-carrier-protein] synthase II
MSGRRVVVTGTSVITSLGHDVREVWQSVCSGLSGIREVERFDCSEFAVGFGGEIKDFDASALVPLERREVRRIDRFGQFALVAACKAIAQAGVDFSTGDPGRYGSVVGSGIGGLDEIEAQHALLFDRGPNRVSALMMPKLIINAAAGLISVRWNLQGPGTAIATACASGTNAIGDAFHKIRADMADVMVAGGSEAALTPIGLAGFARMKALSTRNADPTKASRPFDRDRDGFVLSEGAGILVLEELEFAKKRGAEILAEVLGFGLSANATHLISPDEDGHGAARSMGNALRDARLDPSQVDYINAHATSTPLGDRAETAAIRTVFGTKADGVGVSSTKGQTGHLLGASGAVESVFCLQAIQTGVMPPTINLDNPDADCDLDYIPGDARECPVRIALKNSFGFGGHNASLVFGRYEK